MTKEQLHILQHSLGVNEYGQGEMYRNYYVGYSPGIFDLIAADYMVAGRKDEITGGDRCYHVTEIGKAAMLAQSPKPPKLTQSQKRYREFLNAADAFNCTFREWLKMRKESWYKEMKANG